MPTTLPAEFWQALDQFNQGEFYACHDTLEALWIEADEPDRTLYQGILQIAVGLYHLGNRNWRGAVILMGEGLNRLRRYPDDYEGIDLGPWQADIAEFLETLQALGPEQVATVQLVIAQGSQSAIGESALPADGNLIYLLPMIQKVPIGP
jgi:uncharacterized protein